MEANIWPLVLASQIFQELTWISGPSELSEDCPFTASTKKIVVIEDSAL